MMGLIIQDELSTQAVHIPTGTPPCRHGVMPDPFFVLFLPPQSLPLTHTYKTEPLHPYLTFREPRTMSWIAAD